MRSAKVQPYVGGELKDVAAARLLELYRGVARVAFDAREFDLDSVPTALLHIVIVVDTSPSIEDFVQTICEAVDKVIRGLKNQKETNILITIRGLHNSVPWISTAPIDELTLPALVPDMPETKPGHSCLYKLEDGTPLFRAAVEICAFVRQVDQEMRQAGVKFMCTRVTFLSDADDNDSEPLTARMVRSAVLALKATGNFTFTGIGVGKKRRLFVRIFRAMGLDVKDISTAADSQEIIAEFAGVVSQAIEATKTLAIMAG